MMNLVLKSLCLLVLTGTLSGCSDSYSRNQAPRPDAAVDFATFVRGDIDNTGGARKTVDINDQEFTFNDRNNEQAPDNPFVQQAPAPYGRDSHP